MIDIAGYISIHAPTRGATKHLKGAETVEKFQSTLPREERQNVEQYIQRLSDFNPRSHERSDSNGSYLFILQEISIHAPTRGATNFSASSLNIILFQSTLPREERHMPLSEITVPHWISIHAPTRGATIVSVELCDFLLFQSTLPREERRF